MGAKLSDVETLALFEDLELARTYGCPSFIVGQRCRDDDGHFVLRGRLAREVHAEVFVAELGLGKWMLPLYVAEMGGSVGPESFAVREQEVERAMGRNLGCQLAQGVGEFFNAGDTGMRFP